MECDLCASEEQPLQECIGESGNQILLCESCCVCENCEDWIEVVEQENWVLIERIMYPAGWVFEEDISKFKRYEDYALYCGYCKDIYCKTCKSMKCRHRCETCSMPCSTECDCKDEDEDYDEKWKQREFIEEHYRKKNGE